MAYVVPRPGGRWEIRESRSTELGPRSRTLASFRALSEEVIQRAAAAAVTPVSIEALRQACARAGVESPESRADAAARILIRELEAGRAPSAQLHATLSGRMSAAAAGARAHPRNDQPRMSEGERGQVLADLLRLTDSLPTSRRGPLRFPRINSTRSSA